MRIPGIGVGLTLVVCLATSIPLETSAQDATPAGSPATSTASLEITSQDVLGSDVGQALSLSPDGRWVALARPAASSLESADEICAYPIVTREAPTCVAFTGEAIAADSVAWSPDSTRFAFTEDLPRRMIDSDIWVFDRTDAALVNLTDDDVQGDLFEVDGIPLSDLAPTWSPDGEQIAFARSGDTPLGESGTLDTTIQRISADGGEPTEVTSASDQVLAVFAGIRWQADDTILYSVDQPDPDSADGLWAVAADGGVPEQIVDAAAIGFDATILVDLSVGGLGLLKISEANSNELNPVGFAIVDLATRDTQTVTLDVAGPVNPSGLDAGPIRPSMLAAAFSPDGGSLLTVGTLAGSLPTLILRDLETGVDVGLGELDALVGAEDFSAGMSWGANGFVLARAAQNTSLLLTLYGTEAGG